MDRPKLRKAHEGRAFACEEFNFSINGKDFNNRGRNKHKKHGHSVKKKYEMSPNSYLMNWPQQARMYPFTQRQFSTSDSSVCHYSVPLNFSFEPVSLPIYSALIQSPGNCTVPLEIDNHSNRSKHHKTYSKNRQSKTNAMEPNEVPAIFETPRFNNGDQQDYTSLPPVNCDIYTAKESDTEAACKRRFSDPGIGQVSSDECSSSRYDESSNSSGTAEPQNNDFLSLLEQVNELREDNSYLKKELHETKLELETLKIHSETRRSIYDDIKPGALSDAISEIRNAVKLSEDTLVSKVTQMIEKNSLEHHEAQVKLEEKLTKEMSERLFKIEEQLNKATLRDEPDLPASKTVEVPPSKDSDVQQQLLALEQEKLQLRKELQEAVTKRKIAEATTEKLESLVGILRKKINGVSLESSMTDEKHTVVRPLALSLEKNPFIIANNIQGQKSMSIPIFKSSKVSTFKGYTPENTEDVCSNLSENKENETGENSDGNGVCSSNSPPSDTPTVTAQVTITGPVTDL